MRIEYLNIDDNIIIDIRESYQYKLGHIPNAINIPFDILELAPERYLNKTNTYYLYCDKGIKSLEISNEVNKKGYKTYSIEGGYDSWKNLLIK